MESSPSVHRPVFPRCTRPHTHAALRGGDLTAYKGGQVTLDPRPHIKREPFGMVILPLVSALATGWPMGYASAPDARL